MLNRTIDAATSTIAVLATLALAAPARAQSGDKLSMPNVSIEGERQTPDIFFVFPTGKGGNVSAPRFRDYGPDILAPVVKPWFERDTMVNPVTAHVTSEDKIDLDEALKAPPASREDGVAPVEAAARAPSSAFSPRSQPSIPPGARSLPPVAPGTLGAPSSAEPSIPSSARALPSSSTPGMLGAPSSPEPSIPPAARSLPPAAPGTLGAPSSAEPSIPPAARSPGSSSPPSTLVFPSSSEPSIPSSARALPSAPARSSSTLAFPPSSAPSSIPASRPMPSAAPGGYDPMHDPADGYVPPPS